MISALSHMILFHLASLLAITALWKFIHFRSFVRLAVDYSMVPPFLSRIAGSLIPFLELGAAVLLLHDDTFVFGALILCLLLTGFFFAVLHVLKAKRNLNCGCYGKLMEGKADAFTLAKILYLFLVTLLLAFTVPLPWINYSPSAFMAGFSLTILFLLAQKVWFLYQESMERLRENR